MSVGVEAKGWNHFRVKKKSRKAFGTRKPKLGELNSCLIVFKVIS